MVKSNVPNKRSSHSDKKLSIGFFIIALAAIGTAIFCWFEGYTTSGIGNCGGEKIQPGQICATYINGILNNTATYQDLQRNPPYAQMVFSPLIILSLTCLIAGIISVFSGKKGNLAINIFVTGIANLVFGGFLSFVALITVGQLISIPPGLLTIIVGVLTFPFSCIFIVLDNRSVKKWRIAEDAKRAKAARNNRIF